MIQTWLPMECAPVASVPLCAADMELLKAAGAGVSEFAAVQLVADTALRIDLIDFFTFICPQNFRRLRAVVRLARYWKDRRHPRRCGADIIYNSARAQFRDFGKGGSNDEHCFITRALALVAPDLEEMLVMKPAAKAHILIAIGWKIPAHIDWTKEALPSLSADEREDALMPP
jgi:hypothetical protein